MSKIYCVDGQISSDTRRGLCPYKQVDHVAACLNVACSRALVVETFPGIDRVPHAAIAAPMMRALSSIGSSILVVYKRHRRLITTTMPRNHAMQHEFSGSRSSITQSQQRHAMQSPVIASYSFIWKLLHPIDKAVRFEMIECTNETLTSSLLSP